jgi:hypothetical protein
MYMKVNRYFLKVGRCNQWNDEHEVRFLLDQNAELDFYRASSLKQQTKCINSIPSKLHCRYNPLE